MDQTDIFTAAALLSDAERTATPRERLVDRWPDLDPESAYRIQDLNLEQRLQAGDELTGVKLGLTSRAKQQAMGVDSPLTAWLTAGMRVGAGGAPPLANPRVEPEIVLVMGERLQGPGVTADHARAAVGGVRAGLEVIDSRFSNFRFTLSDVIADNASAARYILSDLVLDPSDIDLVSEQCAFHLDGELVGEATGSAVLGDPALALALAANTLAERGRVIEAGWIVMTGGLTDAVPVGPDSIVTATFQHLGEVSLSGTDI